MEVMRNLRWEDLFGGLGAKMEKLDILVGLYLVSCSFRNVEGGLYLDLF